MKSRNSQRKRRQERRLLPEQLALRAVGELELPAFVDRVEDEFQGEWNTLCLFVYLGQVPRDEGLRELRETFRRCIEIALEDSAPPIKWSVSIWHGQEILQSVDSEDS